MPTFFFAQNGRGKYNQCLARLRGGNGLNIETSGRFYSQLSVQICATGPFTDWFKGELLRLCSFTLASFPGLLFHIYKYGLGSVRHPSFTYKGNLDRNLTDTKRWATVIDLDVLSKMAWASICFDSAFMVRILQLFRTKERLSGSAWSFAIIISWN